MKCLNCSKTHNEEGRFCKSCNDTMPAHIRPFTDPKILNMIDEVAGILENTDSITLDQWEREQYERTKK